MKKKKQITKKIVILVILSGLFNLSSFFFDQMVIQSEFKNRSDERRLTELKVSLEKLSFDINSLNDLSFDIAKSSNHFYHHLPITMYGSLGFANDLEDNGDSKKQNIFDKLDKDKIYKDFLEKFNNIIPDFNKKINETNLIISNSFPNLKKDILIDELLIDPKLFKTFRFEISNDEKIMDDINNENFRIYSEVYEKITRYADIKDLTQYYLYVYEENYINTFSNFFKILDEYAEQKNKINYYILLSIISQILGILFLLFLFKSIFSNRNKSNV